jgi:flagellar basal body-associated protein FliL
MAEEADVQTAVEEEPKKKRGKKGPILALLALVGAAVAGLMFWRSRKGSATDDEFDDEDDL